MDYNSYHQFPAGEYVLERLACTDDFQVNQHFRLLSPEFQIEFKISRYQWAKCRSEAEVIALFAKAANDALAKQGKIVRGVN